MNKQKKKSLNSEIKCNVLVHPDTSAVMGQDSSFRALSRFRLFIYFGELLGLIEILGLIAILGLIEILGVIGISRMIFFSLEINVVAPSSVHVHQHLKVN